MNLDSSQTGVLITAIQADSPAASAGLRAGTRSFKLGGKKIMIGGDIIIAVDGHPITSADDLSTILTSAQPGDVARLTIIRGNTLRRVFVTLTAQITQ